LLKVLVKKGHQRTGPRLGLKASIYKNKQQQRRQTFSLVLGKHPRSELES
jgi:hypothetical protein